MAALSTRSARVPDAPENRKKGAIEQAARNHRDGRSILTGFGGQPIGHHDRQRALQEVVVERAENCVTKSGANRRDVKSSNDRDVIPASCHGATEVAPYRLPCPTEVGPYRRPDARCHLPEVGRDFSRALCRVMAAHAAAIKRSQIAFMSEGNRP
jgi:hypothetical protein